MGLRRTGTPGFVVQHQAVLHLRNGCRPVTRRSSRFLCVGLSVCRGGLWYSHEGFGIFRSLVLRKLAYTPPAPKVLPPRGATGANQRLPFGTYEAAREKDREGRGGGKKKKQVYNSKRNSNSTKKGSMRWRHRGAYRSDLYSRLTRCGHSSAFFFLWSYIPSRVGLPLNLEGEHIQ